MERAQKENRKLPPDRMPKLLQKWEAIIKKHESDLLFIGGKSMGGRAATLLDPSFLAENVVGIINFGFPFHAPGKEPGDRIEHLKKIKTPCLFNQGERDPMGTKEEVGTYPLSKKIKMNYLLDGNHDLKPRVKSGKTLEDNLEEAVDEMIKFVERLT